MATTERIVSERVVSSRVIGSSNPILKRFGRLKGSIGGLCAAPVLVIIGFLVLFGGERLTKKSEVVEELSLEQAIEVTADSGTHKLAGVPTIEEAAKAPEFGNTLYYNYRLEEYREVEEVETETVTRVENGKEIEDTIERTKIVEKWVEEESRSEWATFKLGTYTIKPSGAKMEFDYMTKTYYEDYFEFTELDSGRTITPELGDRRIVIDYLAVDEDLIVVGDISGNTISGGDTFIISNKNDEELITELKSEENMIYWAMKVGAWFLFTIGIMSLLGPILSIIDFIPLVGKSASCAASIVAGLISLGIVLAGTIIIKYWLICLVLLVFGVFGLAALLAYLVASKSDGKKKEKEDKK